MPIVMTEMSAMALRPGARSRRARSLPSVEALMEEIASITVERQALRTREAAPATLERNRRKLVRKQWDLSRALIERYLPAA